MTALKTIRTLEAISKSASPGPSPAFTVVHVSRAVLLIGDEGHIGRIELSKRLGVGEGAARTIIKHLAERSIVTSAKEGSVLSPRGLTLYKSLRSKLSQVHQINAGQLALDKANAAVLVKSARIVKRGIEQRDAAIRAGATGACTLVYAGRKLQMPMGESEEWAIGPDDPVFVSIQELFNPKDGDAITIASAPNLGLAEHAAVAAALTLVT